MSTTPGVPFIRSLKAPANITVNSELSIGQLRFSCSHQGRVILTTDYDMHELLSFRPERSGEISGKLVAGYWLLDTGLWYLVI